MGRKPAVTERPPSREARDNHELRRILRAHVPALVTYLTDRLRRVSGSRYRDLPTRILTERCHLLVEALIRSTYADPESLGEYVGRVTRTRLDEGFGLEELQRALRLLEVEAWRILVAKSSSGSIASNLCGLSIALGNARDELARASEAHAYAAGGAGRNTPR